MSIFELINVPSLQKSDYVPPAFPSDGRLAMANLKKGLEAHESIFIRPADHADRIFKEINRDSELVFRETLKVLTEELKNDVKKYADYYLIDSYYGYTNPQQKELAKFRYRFQPAKDTFMTLNINGRIFDFVDLHEASVSLEELYFVSEWRVSERSSEIVYDEYDIIKGRLRKDSTVGLIADALTKIGWRLRIREFNNYQ